MSGREDHLAKVDAIQTKYSELLHEMKRLERDHAKARKRADQLQKEKDHSRSEMQKAVSMKHKLETLCRELQKENKRIKVSTESARVFFLLLYFHLSLSVCVCDRLEIKSADSEITDRQDAQDESKKLALNEQAKREELSNKFEATILEIKSRMEEESDGLSSRKINIETDEL